MSLGRFVVRFAVALRVLLVVCIVGLPGWLAAHSNHDTDGTIFYSRGISGSSHADDLLGACEIIQHINRNRMHYRDVSIVEMQESVGYTASGKVSGSSFYCSISWRNRFSAGSGISSYGGSTYCNNASNWPISSQMLSSCLPAEIPNQCSADDPAVGNPVLLSTGQKYEGAPDWASPFDQRFRLERFYTSSPDRLDVSGMGLGHGWSSALFGRMFRANASASRWAVMMGGQRVYHFDAVGAGATTPSRGDHGYALELDVAAEAGRHVLLGADGRSFLYEEIAGDVALLKEMRWSDGYAISLTQGLLH